MDLLELCDSLQTKNINVREFVADQLSNYSKSSIFLLGLSQIPEDLPIECENFLRELYEVSKTLLEEAQMWYIRAIRASTNIEKLECMEKSRAIYFSPELLDFSIKTLKILLTFTESGEEYQRERYMAIEYAAHLSVDPVYLVWIHDFHLPVNDLLYLYQIIFKDEIEENGETPQISEKMTAFRNLIRDTDVQRFSDPAEKSQVIRAYNIWSSSMLNPTERIIETIKLYSGNMQMQREFTTLVLKWIESSNTVAITKHMDLVKKLSSSYEDEIRIFCAYHNRWEIYKIMYPDDRRYFVLSRAQILANHYLESHINTIMEDVDHLDIDLHKAIEYEVSTLQWEPSQKLIEYMAMVEYFKAMTERQPIYYPYVQFKNNVNLVLRHLPKRYHNQYLTLDEIFEWYPQSEQEKAQIQKYVVPTSKFSVLDTEESDALRQKIAELIPQIKACGDEMPSVYLKSMILACQVQEYEPILMDTFANLISEGESIVLASDGRLYAKSSLKSSYHKPIGQQLDPSQDITIFPDPTFGSGETDRLLRALLACAQSKTDRVYTDMEELEKQYHMLIKTLEFCQSQGASDIVRHDAVDTLG